MKNSVFGKTMENLRNHRDIKLVTCNKSRKQLVPQPNYHSYKNIFGPFNGNRNEKDKSKNE